MLELYENIKKRRIELGLSQTELAKRVGYSDKSMISKIEKGKVNLPQSKIQDFADCLMMDPGDLMGEDGTREVFTIRIPKQAMEYPNSKFLDDHFKHEFIEELDCIFLQENNKSVAACMKDKKLRKHLIEYAEFLLSKKESESK